MGNKNMTPCFDCGESISQRALMCPKCGCFIFQIRAEGEAFKDLVISTAMKKAQEEQEDEDRRYGAKPEEKDNSGWWVLFLLVGILIFIIAVSGK